MTQSATGEIRIGTVLRDTYEIVSQIGKGGMGAVFSARHLRLPGKHVAVKVLLGEANLNPELYARFRREAEIASQLGHPNIVEVLDFHSLEDGTPYMVMEYLRGENLARRLKHGALPLPEVLTMARQIGSALQAAHRAGVVHRDLKPANVFLVPTEAGGELTERVKLLDFGISKILASQTVQTQDAMLLGTPQYMSPEQALGKNSELDARTDIFSLGCMLYEMLSGKPPFDGGGSTLAVVYRIVHERAAPLATRCPHLPAHILSAVDKALEKDPKDRFQDVGALILALTGSPLRTLDDVVEDTVASPLPAPRPSQLPTKEQEQPYDNSATHIPDTTASPVAPPRTPSTQLLGAPTPGPKPGFYTPNPPAVHDRPAATLPLASDVAPAKVAPPAPRVDEQRASSGATKALVVGGATVLLGAAVAFGVLRQDAPPAPAATAPAPAVTQEAPPAVAPPAPPAPALEPPVATPAATAAAPAPSRKETPAKQELPELPEHLHKALAEGEQALSAGDSSAALDIAKRIDRNVGELPAELRPKVAASLYVRAGCLAGSLETINLRRASVPRGEHKRVLAYCKAHGFPIKLP
jgi:serine/threonine-protein kinase